MNCWAQLNTPLINNIIYIVIYLYKLIHYMNIYYIFISHISHRYNCESPSKFKMFAQIARIGGTRQGILQECSNKCSTFCYWRHVFLDDTGFHVFARSIIVLAVYLHILGRGVSSDSHKPKIDFPGYGSLCENHHCMVRPGRKHLILTSEARVRGCKQYCH